MKKVKELSSKELRAIVGGKYYGNGVSCTKKGCSVDWSRAFTCSANRAAGAYATGGQATIGKC